MKIHHLIILDESGSMRCVTKETIDGCNETLSVKLPREFWEIC